MLAAGISSTGKDLMDALICCKGPSHKVSAESRLEVCRLHPSSIIPLLAPAGAEDERKLLLSGGTSRGGKCSSGIFIAGKLLNNEHVCNNEKSL